MTWKIDVALPTGERVIVRLYPPGREGVVAYEPDLLRRCAAAGVAVPLVVADSRTGPPAPQPYVAYRKIEGVPLSARWPSLPKRSRERVAGDLVEAIFRLHALRIEGYGELLSAWLARHESWAAFVREAFDEGLASPACSQLPGGLVDDLVAIRRRLDRLPPPGASGLVWGDVSPTNALIDSGDRLVGLLDFEGCLGGDAAMNLGCCLAGHLGTGFYEAIREAWPDLLTEEESARVALYAVVRGMRLVKYHHRPRLPTGRARTPLAELLPGLGPAAADLRARLASQTSS
jgi:aminoglycoside phosphotransferase (APT) family kinase protein